MWVDMYFFTHEHLYQPNLLFVFNPMNISDISDRFFNRMKGKLFCFSPFHMTKIRGHVSIEKYKIKAQ